MIPENREAQARTANREARRRMQTAKREARVRDIRLSKSSNFRANFFSLISHLANGTRRVVAVCADSHSRVAIFPLAAHQTPGPRDVAVLSSRAQAAAD